ncbi:hypothetical protein SEA_DIMINIMUS_89 [Mycobacterium phage Diminimus]|nr:hypothetical protein SEA_AUSPICE_88 [Mycobacterium phage Auspice]WNN96293.1 hypothetical protein SEA_DULCITA_89 [Mycobacterium phage Dulcita]WNO28238.1 hypothetical protein SEA_DIMINIMUS_89 [Mycobacterium phage Diminimus]
MTQPSTQAQRDAYLAGMCKWCMEKRHRAGSPECDDCWKLRGTGATMRPAREVF